MESGGPSTGSGLTTLAISNSRGGPGSQKPASACRDGMVLRPAAGCLFLEQSWARGERVSPAPRTLPDATVPLRRLLSGVAGYSTPLRPPKSAAPRGCRAGHSIRAPSRREFGRARASSLASSWLANAFHEACTRGTSSTTTSQTALWPAHEKRSREWPGSTPTTWRRPGKVPHWFRKTTMSSFRRSKTRGTGAATTPPQGPAARGDLWR